jgi:hypothetical protein
VKQEWIVQVRDASGAAIGDAKVALFAFDPKKHTHFPFVDVPPTHGHSAAGSYEEKGAIAAAEGSWRLVVRAEGKSPVVQPLALKKLPSGEFAASPDGGLALTVVPHLERLTVKGTIVLVRNIFQVTMYDASEIVFIAGIDYEVDTENPHTHEYPSGTDFDLFAQGRRETLWGAGLVNPGTLITHLSCRRVSHSTFVRARGGNWLRVFHSILDEARANVRAKQPNAKPAPGDVSIANLYTYLDSVAKRNRFSVREVGIFSHSYPGGPILYNTEDTTRAPSGARDPADFDARPKDFLPSNTGSWPDLANAIEASARWHIWGCRATVHMQSIARESLARLRAKAPRDGFFLVQTTYKPSHHPEVEQRIDESLNLTIAKWTFEHELLGGYPAAVVSFFDIDVWGAAPGAGASFVKRGDIYAMKVEDNPSVKGYLRREFKDNYVENTDGYLNYRKMTSLRASPRPGFSSTYYRLFRSRRPRIERTVLEPWNGKNLSIMGFDFTHSSRRVQSLVTPGLGGVLHILEEAGTARSFAAYFQDDGAVFRVFKGAADRFTIPGPAL